jgi:hypothetical protein
MIITHAVFITLTPGLGRYGDPNDSAAAGHSARRHRPDPGCSGRRRRSSTADCRHQVRTRVDICECHESWEPTERVYLHFLMPGDRDAISFLREINSFFKILGNIFWLIYNCIYTAQFIIHFKLHFQDFFYKKITKLLVQI